MCSFVERESYKHKYAKNILKEWLDNGLYLFDDTYIREHDSGVWHRKSSVFLEYPVSILNEKYCSIEPYNSLYNSWDEIKFQSTFKEDKETIISRDKDGNITETTFNYWGKECSGYVPSYEETIRYGETIAVCDLAVIHKGIIRLCIEICHKNPVSEEKIKNLYKSGLENLIELDAEWVMRQVKQPEKIKVKRWLIKNGEITI